jgi:hypothetical protein
MASLTEPDVTPPQPIATEVTAVAMSTSEALKVVIEIEKDDLQARGIPSLPARALMKEVEALKARGVPSTVSPEENEKPIQRSMLENKSEHLRLENEKLRTRTSSSRCSACGKPKSKYQTLRKCSGCHAVQYCNTECQKKHWNIGGHKKECNKLKQQQQSTREIKTDLSGQPASNVLNNSAKSSDSTTATARNWFQKLPRHLRLRIFHCLTYRNYVLLSHACTIFKTDLAFSLKYNRVPRCILVPEDYKTLNEGYKRIEQSKGAVTTIVLGQGDHVVEESTDFLGRKVNYLHIQCPVNIVGSPDVMDKSKIVVVGGFHVQILAKNIHHGKRKKKTKRKKKNKKNQGNVHVEHLTIRNKKGDGVVGYSPFTLNDLTIDQCGTGVFASSTLSRCTNINISKCWGNGVCAFGGATIILEGSDTSIYGNCLKGNSNCYGLNVCGLDSKIQIVPPLTKESISKGNGGGGDWGETSVM